MGVREEGGRGEGGRTIETPPVVSVKPARASGERSVFEFSLTTRTWYAPGTRVTVSTHRIPARAAYPVGPSGAPR